MSAAIEGQRSPGRVLLRVEQTGYGGCAFGACLSDLDEPVVFTTSGHFGAIHLHPPLKPL